MKFLRKDRGFFEKVLWSDESKICAKKTGRHFIRKKRREKISKPNIGQIKKYNGGLQIMVWGLIVYDGPEELVWIEGKLNS